MQPQEPKCRYVHHPKAHYHTNSNTHEWVKGHSDKAPWESIKDLQEQGLNRDKIYNVWYNKLAKQYWVSNASANLEPDPTLVEK